MNNTEHLLTILGEECAETAQRASKAARFGLTETQPGQHEDNMRRLERELAEIVAVSELLGLQIRKEDKDAKVARVLKYMSYSRDIGTLDGSVTCSGCSATAAKTSPRDHPSGWSQGGETRDGRLADWCPSCTESQKKSSTTGGGK